MTRPYRTAIWPTRRDLKGCTVTVDSKDDSRICVMWPGSVLGVSMPRAEARMLARRLNQCLDATVKR